MSADGPQPKDVDPVEFLRAVMAISADDAEKVRSQTPNNRKHASQGQDGPIAEYGDDNSPDQ